MSWLLVLTFTWNGQSGDVPAGLMVDQNTCIVAGKGMELILEHANPGLDVTWSCLPPLNEASA